jgi:hypothetical protein
MYIDSYHPSYSLTRASWYYDVSEKMFGWSASVVYREWHATTRPVFRLGRQAIIIDHVPSACNQQSTQSTYLYNHHLCIH